MTKARRIGALLLALGVGATLAGCSGQPGAAAVVDGRAIPASDVREVMTELGAYFQGATTPNVITVLAQEPTVVDVAAEHGVGVSEQDAAKLLDQAVAASGSKETPTFSDASMAVARYSVAYTNITGLADDAVTSELADRLAKLDVTVNPRFGSNGEGSAVADPKPFPWLVVEK
ncbi:MAG TPA: hypothetical protein VNR62_09550 [Cellulomonas sp.]|nr:hypothetical protein [Cellulomonas sp.]